MKSKILISTSSFGELDPSLLSNLIETYSCVFNAHGRRLKTEELLELVADINGIIAGTEIYSREILSKARNLKVISRVGIGTDNIDLDFCREQGINVATTKTDLSFSVAELVISLFFSFFRNIPAHQMEMKNNNWQREMGETISGKTLGIIGLGSIGKKLVELTIGLNLNIVAYDPCEDKEFSSKYSVKYCDINELLKCSDIVTIHAPSAEDNQPIISEEQFKIMKPNALLINTSRGKNINEEFLFEALKNKTIAGACIDVFNDEPYKGNLASLDNVILTPHIGGYTSDVRRDLESEAVENLRKFL